ncbi:hypothetical protein [Actinacidiphila glaucinigra]|uniref:hypothetical protein n=1 Tax=Actinacidiphila glaucinigra TaxID=235986 RepID=UPI00366E0C69
MTGTVLARLPGVPAQVRFVVVTPVPGAKRLLRLLLPRMRDLEMLQLLANSGYDTMMPLLETMPAWRRLATRCGVPGKATVGAVTNAFSTRSTDFLRRQVLRYRNGEQLHNVVLTTPDRLLDERAA